MHSEERLIVTDTELLNRIESDLFNGPADYLHVYVHDKLFVVEIDGQYVSRATLRDALEAALQPPSQSGVSE